MTMKGSVKKNKFKRVIFVTISILIAIGLVIPLAGLFQSQPDYSKGPSAEPTKQTLQERLAGLEAQAKEKPNDIPVLMELGEAYHYAGKSDQAIMTYEKVLAIDPSNSDARIDIATIYYYSSKPDQAIAQLQELIKRDPDYKYAHYLYGVVLATGKQNYAAGIEEMEKFISLAKEGPDVERAKVTINEWKAKMSKQQ